MDDWEFIDAIERVHFRTHNSFSWGTLSLGDDTQPTQTWQLEGYHTELRDGVRRVSEFGYSSMPLPGAKAAILFQGGSRSRGVIIGVEDPRYRPTGLKPGECAVNMVDGAGGDGTGGTMRHVFQSLLGWLTTIFGKTINVGDSNTTGVNVGAGATTLTITVGGKAINITSSGGAITMTAPAGTITANGNVLG